jgi:hypothetical protein
MSRMGIHCNTLGAVDKLVDYYRRVQPPVIKTMTLEHDVLAAVRAASPQTKIIYRMYTDTQEYGAQGARWIQSLVKRVRDWPEIDYVEGYNEVGVSDLKELARYAAFEQDRVEALAAIGKKSVVGNFSTGTLSDPQMAVIMPMLTMAHAHGAWFGFHEYSGPFMQWMAGANQWAAYQAGTWQPDPCTDPNVLGWTTLRYRRFWPNMKAAGIGDMPMVITEGGIDDVQPRPGPQGKGYKSYIGTEWERLPGIGDYALQTEWYSRQTAYDRGGDRPVIVGWVDFGWATQDPAWSSFDLSTDDTTREKLITAQLRVTDAAPPPPMIEGLDVSVDQGHMDWAVTKAKGIQYVWVRATEGASTVDPEYEANAVGAPAAGIAAGPYHYWNPSAGPTEQADWFVKHAKQHRWSLAPMVNLVYQGSANSADLRTMVEYIAGNLREPFLRTNGAWLDAYLVGDRSWMADYPLMIVASTDNPEAPAPWTDWTVCRYAVRYDGLAYGAATARLNHYRYRGTVADLMKEGDVVVPPPDFTTALLAAAAAEQQAHGIRLNKNAALQQAILRDGYWATTNEQPFEYGGTKVIYQRAEDPRTGASRVYYWDGSAVKWAE